jgi:hypothetical protein
LIPTGNSLHSFCRIDHYSRMTNSSMLANFIYYTRHYSMKAEAAVCSEDVASVLHSLGTRLGHEGTFCNEEGEDG